MTGLASLDQYGQHRLFVYLRLDGDDNDQPDAAVQAIEIAGQPVVRLELRDKHDLGAEFFRWEFATAVAGAIIAVNPFDQPNVQAAKDMTESVLGQFQAAGFPTVICGPGSIEQAHQPDEWIALSELEKGAAFMQRLAEKLS